MVHTDAEILALSSNSAFFHEFMAHSLNAYSYFAFIILLQVACP